MIETCKICVLAVALAGAAVLLPGRIAAEQARADEVAAGDNEASTKELAALQGRWECHGVIAVGTGYQETETFLYGGKTLERGVGLTAMALEVRGDVFEFAGTPTGRATARLDPSQRPKAIDLTNAKSRKWVGVYELDGDTLTINLGLGKDRPEKVTGEVNGVFGQANALYKRARK